MQKFSRLNHPDPMINRIQDNISKSYNDIVDIPMLQGVAVKQVVLSTSGTAVQHKLGRTPVGWFVTDKVVDANIWRTDWDSMFLYLDTDLATTIDLWVF